jgi:hypothetical protein
VPDDLPPGDDFSLAELIAGTPEPVAAAPPTGLYL